MLLTPAQSQVALDYFKDEAPVLFLRLSEEGVVLAANHYCREILGPSLVGCDFWGLLVDFQKSFNIEEYIQKDRPALLNLSIPNSLPRTYLFTFCRVNDSILVFGKSDAEEPELLRTELFHANQELNNLTRSLHKTNAQLIQLNSLKNQFLGMAAHDLRKPISIILNYAEFLLDETSGLLDEEHTGFLSKIENSAFFMKRLVDDFLDVSAIEAGRFQLNIAPVNPTQILARSLILARVQAGKKKIALEVAAAEDLAEIALDADKIEQAMSNVIGNAIEHSAAGTSIAISLQKVDENIIFSVRDQGVGMSQEAVSQLFNPFSRSSTVKTGGEKGTGLGLTITRKIVEAHQGEITVESTEGFGTTFTISLTPHREILCSVPPGGGKSAVAGKDKINGYDG